jgi:hypothetical protein
VEEKGEMETSWLLYIVFSIFSSGFTYDLAAVICFVIFVGILSLFFVFIKASFPFQK